MNDMSYMFRPLGCAGAVCGRRTQRVCWILLLGVCLGILPGCTGARATHSGSTAPSAVEAPKVLELRLTKASGARVRATPSQKADEVGRVPLASVLEVFEKSATQVQIGSQTDQWLRIRAEDGLEGWVFGALTAPYEPTRRTPMLLELFEQRLTIEGASFTDLADLQNAIEKTQLEVGRAPEWYALELLRLKALKAALAQVPLELQGQEPYGSWLRKNDGILFHDEIQGAWLMRADKLWELEPSFRGTQWGDPLAWFAASLPLGGECEGYLPCYLEGERFTHGRYLDAYPRGLHAQDALSVLKDNLSQYLNPSNGFQAQGDDALVVEAAERLRELVFKTAETSDRQLVLKLLEKLVMKYAK